MCRISFYAFLLLLACLPGLFSEAWAVEAPVDISFASRGDAILARVQIEIPKGYHAYAHKPGDAGKPAKLNFVLENDGVMPVFYPQGLAEPDIYDNNIRVNVYYGKTSILVTLPPHANGKMYAATLDLLLCSNRNCVPLSENLTGTIPEAIPRLSSEPWAAEALALLEQEGASSGSLTLEEGIKPPLQAEATIPNERKAGQPVARLANQAPAGTVFAFSPRYFAPGAEIYSLWKALLFGALAGLLLNVMPCVLPVLTLKVSGILLLGEADNRQKLAEFRRHNICFALGVLTFFTLLAILLGLADMMWGQLYQNEGVLLVMLLLVFLMGLSMLGVFTLPMFDLRMGAGSKSPNFNAFLTGLVSTFLATPCSGPLLGGVLAWAFLQPLPVLVAIFWSVGIGMSLPYLAFSIYPGLARFLPRPGAWMHMFEKILGFFLLGTALYLLSILPQDKYIPILCLLLVAAVCAWLLRTYCGLAASAFRRRVGAVLMVCILAVGAYHILAPAPAAIAWQNFSAEAFSRNLGQKAMLLEFTADWCPNCKFLESAVLTSGRLRSLEQKYGVELVKVDLTHTNDMGQKLLLELGSKSIPVTALFPAGDLARQPVVLRDLYSAEALEEASRVAFGPG